jgi:hypothetical protein
LGALQAVVLGKLRRLGLDEDNVQPGGGGGGGGGASPRCQCVCSEGLGVGLVVVNLGRGGVLAVPGCWKKIMYIKVGGSRGHGGGGLLGVELVRP